MQKSIFLYFVTKSTNLYNSRIYIVYISYKCKFYVKNSSWTTFSIWDVNIWYAIFNLIESNFFALWDKNRFIYINKQKHFLLERWYTKLLFWMTFRYVRGFFKLLQQIPAFTSSYAWWSIQNIIYSLFQVVLFSLFFHHQTLYEYMYI